MANSNQYRRVDEPSYCRGCHPTHDADGLCSYHAQRFDKLIATTRKHAGLDVTGTGYELKYGEPKSEPNWDYCDICEMSVPPSHQH